MNESGTVYVIASAWEHELVHALAPLGATVVPLEAPSALLRQPVRAGPGCMVLDIAQHEPRRSSVLREAARHHESLPCVFVGRHADGLACMRPVLDGWSAVETDDPAQHLRDVVRVSLACDAHACA